jgi:hypothetical protein
MRAVLQRVSQARVTVAGETVGQIGPGLLALVGVAGAIPRATACTSPTRSPICAFSMTRTARSTGPSRNSRAHRFW